MMLQVLTALFQRFAVFCDIGNDRLTSVMTGISQSVTSQIEDVRRGSYIRQPNPLFGRAKLLRSRERRQTQ